MSIIRKLHEGLVSGLFSCRELTQHYLDAIERDNPVLGAYVHITAQTALKAADAVDARLAEGQALGLLEGIPMTLKDNLSTNGLPTTCCSRILEGYEPIYDATVWQLLQKQGAILLGKTNMDEFAMGSSCETGCYGPALNPHNIEHVSGGSSGGGASAVSANLAAYALGSDTGGSIRQPASFCGIVGLKPTYGAVSRFGLIAYASSFDQVGPIAHCVEDAAIVYDAISAPDPMDATCQGAVNGPTLPSLHDDLSGLRIGIAEPYFNGIDPSIQQALSAAMDEYRALGAQIVPVTLPVLDYALPVYYILACAEAASNLGRYDGIRYGHRTDSYVGTHEMICKTRSEGFGDEVKRRILLGNYVLSSGYYDAYYKKAQNLRGTIVKAFDEAFTHCDMILAPTVPMTAFPLGFTAQSQVQTYQTDICTVPVNIAGLPAISLPCGFDATGLPIGMQLIGNRFSEARLLNAAYCYEKATDGQMIRNTEWGFKV